jgi:creatinine amidohydrolase
MRIAEMNWMQVEEYLQRDDRAIVPLGSTEQHAYLSLATDSILAERVAVEAAEPLGVPVFPVLAYGITPQFVAYPGTVSLRVSTYLAVLGDVLDTLYGAGFRRIVVVNGHGGNVPGLSFLHEWIAGHATATLAWHNWWAGPKMMQAVKEIDQAASHASWMENFPWNRVATSPDTAKPTIDFATLWGKAPEVVRRMIGDGNYGGVYQKPDAQMLALWQVGVEETREIIAGI